MNYTKKVVISSSICLIIPVIGLLAIEQLGGGVFNTFAGSRLTDPIIEPDTIVAWAALLALACFSYASVVLVRGLRGNQLSQHKVGTGLLWLFAGVATASAWVVWSWSW